MEVLNVFVLCWLLSVQIHTSRMTMSDDVNLEEFVMTKDEFSGADIKAICTEAGLLALRERRMKVSALFAFCVAWIDASVQFRKQFLVVEKCVKRFFVFDF